MPRRGGGAGRRVASLAGGVARGLGELRHARRWSRRNTHLVRVVVGDERIRRERGRKGKNEKMTSGLHLSVAHLTFHVSAPNRKWVHPINQTENGFIPSHELESGPSHPTSSPNQTLPKGTICPPGRLDIHACLLRRMLGGGWRCFGCCNIKKP